MSATSTVSVLPSSVRARILVLTIAVSDSEESSPPAGGCVQGTQDHGRKLVDDLVESFAGNSFGHCGFLSRRGG